MRPLVSIHKYICITCNKLTNLIVGRILFAKVWSSAYENKSEKEIERRRTQCKNYWEAKKKNDGHDKQSRNLRNCNVMDRVGLCCMIPVWAFVHLFYLFFFALLCFFSCGFLLFVFTIFCQDNGTKVSLICWIHTTMCPILTFFISKTRLTEFTHRYLYKICIHLKLKLEPLDRV